MAMTLPEAIRTKLEQHHGPVFFSDLSAHLERDAVFVVAPGLSLIDCGVAVAMDQVEVVRVWIDSGELRKPSVVERREWPTATARKWMAIVVQPFILIQDPPS
jgi:hypothetical protein